MNTDDRITCSKCGNEIHPLEVFPGGICLDCHRPIAERELRTMTAEDLASMWGAKVLR